MKYAVTRFKDLHRALKELEPFIRNGTHLQTGKPFKRLGGMRSREALANWLLCAAANSVTEADRLTFSSDPVGGDGVIHDTKTERSWPTEHILIPDLPLHSPEKTADRILKAIGKKQAKGGAAYAGGKTLVVFLNSAGEKWHPNRVARQLPDPLHF